MDLQPPPEGLSGVTVGYLLSSYLAVAEVADDDDDDYPKGQ